METKGKVERLLRDYKTASQDEGNASVIQGSKDKMLYERKRLRHPRFEE